MSHQCSFHLIIWKKNPQISDFVETEVVTQITARMKQIKDSSSPFRRESEDVNRNNLQQIEFSFDSEFLQTQKNKQLANHFSQMNPTNDYWSQAAEEHQWSNVTNFCTDLLLF